MKIKVKALSEENKFEFINKGEWIDLKAYLPQEIKLNKGNDYKFNLGIAMQLPEGFEAIVAPRSSTFKNYGLILTNSVGVIDSSYSGNNDIWGTWFFKIKANNNQVNHGDRICQFRIQPSQKASVWTKIKWLFTRKIEFEFVNTLDNPNRGGYGSTGTK